MLRLRTTVHAGKGRIRFMEEEIQQRNDVSVRDYLDLLRRRRAIIIQTFVIVLVVGVMVTFMTKALYQTKARILVEGKSLTVTQFDAKDPLSGIFMPNAGFDVATQIEVLQSTKVLEDTHLHSGVALDAVKLDVKQVFDTDVIEYRVDSHDPKAAERFARELPRTYLGYVTGNRRTEVASALQFAQKRFADETERLQAAESELQRVRQRSEIYSIDDGRKAKLQEMTDAMAELQKSDADLASQQARVNALINQRHLVPEMLESPTIATNPQIEILKNALEGLKTQRQAALTLYKSESPKVQDIDAQIADTERRLRESPATVTTTVSARNPTIQTFDDKIADARTLLRGSFTQRGKSLDRLSTAKSALGEFSSFEVTQARLESEVERHRTAIPVFAKSVDDLSLRLKATHDPVQVIAPAEDAILVAPKKMTNIILACLVGLILGVCFAMLQEYLDDRINLPDEARRLLQAPVLGYVPMVEREDARLLAQSHGGSLLESYRVLRTNVRFAAVDSATMSILISSTVPGEGKSVTAANLAVAMALDGLRVILVDCDLRRPTIHSKFDMEQRPGVTNVLVGHTTLNEALKESGVPGLRILTAGPIPPNPAELLNSRAMHQLHQDLKGIADVVLYDSPPFLATADAQILSSEVDGVLYVVQFGEAKKSAVRHAADMMEQTRARVLGLVFNKIDLSNKRDDYYYGYYSYYSHYSTAETGDGTKRVRREFDAMSAMAASRNGAEGNGLTVVKERAEEEEDLA